MKIAFFVGSLNRGGMETLVLDTFRKRRETPFESILIYRNEGGLSDDFRATGVPMFRIKPNRFRLGYVTNLRRLLKREGVDILHTQTLWNGLVGVLCTLFSKVKLVSSFHGFLTYRINKFIAPFVMMGADSVVFVSNYQREWYLKHVLFTPPKSSYVVYNGIDFSKFDIKYTIPTFLKEDDSDIARIVRLVMVGNFERVRSQFFLCRVIQAYKERGGRDFRFYFIGKRSTSEPWRYEECVQYCKDNGLLNSSVFFLGGRGDVPAILQSVDAFVYSSVFDTFGIAVVEAMATGIPVLVNDWEVMEDITENGELAILYRTQDIDDCVAKLNDLVNHLEQRKALTKKVARGVRERFSIANHIRNLNEVYKATLS